MTKGHSERHFVAIWPKNRYLCGMKPDQLIFRPAVEADAPRILDIIRQAQACMRPAAAASGKTATRPPPTSPATSSAATDMYSPTPTRGSWRPTEP